MKTVWKFSQPFPKEDDFSIVMPRGAEILHADIRRDGLTLWARVDPQAPVCSWALRLAGTGHPLDNAGAHIATTVDGPFVWHLFERIDG